MKRRLRNDSGMTLVELMLACGVMAMTLSMLFGAMVSMNAIGQTTQARTEATTSLANILEQVRYTPSTSLMSTRMSLAEGPGKRRTVVLKAANNAGTWITLPSNTSIGTLPNPLEVQATLVWEDEGGRVYSASASTRVAR